MDMGVLCTWFLSHLALICLAGVCFLCLWLSQCNFPHDDEDADEMLFSYNSGVLWWVYQLIYYLIVPLLHVKGFAVTCNHLADQGRCFRLENHGSWRASIASLLSISTTTKAAEAGKVPSARIPQICTGSFLKLSLWAFQKREDSLNQTVKECFPAAARHAWAHGGTKCLAKKGWRSLSRQLGLWPQSHIPEARGKRLSIAEQHKLRNLSFNRMSGNTLLASIFCCLSSVLRILLLVILHPQIP